MVSLPLRWAATTLALLALLPVAAFWLGRGVTVVGLSAVSVVIIAASIYLMFGEAPTRTTG